MWKTIQLSDIIMCANLIKLWYYKNVLSTKNAQISTTALSEVQRMYISILLQSFVILRVFKNLCQSLVGNFLKEKLAERQEKAKDHCLCKVCPDSPRKALTGGVTVTCFKHWLLNGLLSMRAHLEEKIYDRKVRTQ